MKYFYILTVCILFTSCSFFESSEEQSKHSQDYIDGKIENAGKEQESEERHADSLENYSHIFPEEALQPRPNMDKHIHSLVLNYEKDYKAFESTYASSKKRKKRKSSKKRRGKVLAEPGLWQRIKMSPSPGRIYDLELNPKNPKEIYVNPDGDGIFVTKDGGRVWKSITDSIPSRLHRQTAHNIIVDPMDFKHVFSISPHGYLYETKDQGGSWEFIENTGHANGRAPKFKCVEAFRDSKKKLILIGTVTNGHAGWANGGWKAGVYRSSDAAKTWEFLDLGNEKFQEFEFHRRYKDIIYLAGRSKLYISKDAGKTFSLLKDFETGTHPMFISTCYGKKANALYVAVSTETNKEVSTKTVRTANTRVYFSKDRGKTWELRQDSANGVGYDKGIFGNDTSSGWTSFFEVDPFDSDHLVAASVGGCESFDGGKTWTYDFWGIRADAIMPNGGILPSPHGSHNADNHVLKFHPKVPGLFIKGCDAGTMQRSSKYKKWTNIHGDIPALLLLSISVNEFGDRYIAGNTQDTNIQTHRYGKWENETGYEGSVLFINPYSNMSYYPYAPIEKEEGKGFLEEHPGTTIVSWGYPRTAVNYNNSDQLFVSFARRVARHGDILPKYLYMTSNRGKDFKRVANLDDEVYGINVSRDGEERLTAFTKSSVLSSLDFGGAWTTNSYPSYFRSGGGPRRVSAAVNPNKPDQIWVGGNQGKIITSDDGGKKWQDISGKLPKGHVVELLYHEGSEGDLYALLQGYGVFYKAADKKEWVLWMDGYNLKEFKQISIDYQHQLLVAASEGRGAWQAKLMNSYERFYKKDFKIKQVNSVNGTNVFTIDKPFITPDYYNYKWYRNKKRVGRNLPTLHLRNAKKNDSIILKIYPKRFSRISTTSKALKLRIAKRSLNTNEKEGLTVSDKYVDLGNLEFFDTKKDFTFETTVNLNKAGVIAGNRRHFYRDAKGWLLDVDKNGVLRLYLSFKQNGSFMRASKGPKEQALVLETTGSRFSFKKWNQVAFTFSDKTVSLFINGKLVSSAKLRKEDQNKSLNSVLNTTVLADPMGRKRCDGKIKSVKIWGKALSARELNSQGRQTTANKDLLYYVNFGAKKLREAYTRKDIVMKEQPAHFESTNK